MFSYKQNLNINTKIILLFVVTFFSTSLMSTYSKPSSYITSLFSNLSSLAAAPKAPSLPKTHCNLGNRQKNCETDTQKHISDDLWKKSWYLNKKALNKEAIIHAITTSFFQRKSIVDQASEIDNKELKIVIEKAAARDITTSELIFTLITIFNKNYAVLAPIFHSYCGYREYAHKETPIPQLFEERVFQHRKFFKNLLEEAQINQTSVNYALVSTLYSLFDASIEFDTTVKELIAFIEKKSPNTLTDLAKNNYSHRQ